MSGARVPTPEEVVADYLAGLPYDFPDDADPQMDAAGAIFALHRAGYRLFRVATPESQS